jgi:copper transport protein
MATTLRKGRLAFILALLATAMTASTVLAHALLVRSEPANNANLVEPPQEVRLWFSEAISAEFSGAQLLDVHGRALKVANIHIEPAENLMILTLPELTPGLYSVRWEVLSEADGHFSRGLLVFGIGTEVDAGSAATVETETTLPLPEVGLRWLNFAILLALVGSVAVTYLVLNPGSYLPLIEVELVRAAARRRALRLALGCAGLALLVGLSLLLWQAGLLLETLPEGAGIAGVSWQLLSRTRWGMLWVVRQALLLLLVGALFHLYRKSILIPIPEGTPKTPRRFIPPIAVSSLLLGLLATQSLISHAAAITPTATLPVVVDTLHLLAASFWVGGLLALSAGLLPLIRRDRADFSILVRNSWRPFSRLAVLSVALLTATGLFSAGQHVASVDALLTTLYGQALATKLGLMLAAGSLGLLNSVLLHPDLVAPLARLLHRPAGWTPLSLRRLPGLILGEVTLGLLAIMATGVITATPTARGPEFEISPDDIPTLLNQTVDDMLVTFSASPNRPGQNLFIVRAVSSRRPPPAEVLRLILRFTFLGQEVGRASTDAVEIEPGLYQAGGAYLSLAGPWQVQVVVRRAGLKDSVAVFNWTVAPIGPARPVIISNRPLEALLTGAAAAIILVVFLFIAGMQLARRGLFLKPGVRFGLRLKTTLSTWVRRATNGILISITNRSNDL